MKLKIVKITIIILLAITALLYSTFIIFHKDTLVEKSNIEIYNINTVGTIINIYYIINYETIIPFKKAFIIYEDIETPNVCIYKYDASLFGVDLGQSKVEYILNLPNNYLPVLKQGS